VERECQMEIDFILDSEKDYFNESVCGLWNLFFVCNVETNATKSEIWLTGVNKMNRYYIQIRSN
jgi:hypothetical protein